MTITPRWEWRTFGDTFGPAEEHFAALTPARVEESDETYLLSVRSDASVKVRGGLMDVKHLEAVNDDGLEQWLPILKAEFPLPGADVVTVLHELRMHRPQIDRQEYTLDELIAEVVLPRPELRAVGVHKRRARYTVGGAMAELSELTAAGRSTRTIAVEMEDPAVVVAAVAELGLADRPNTCMARVLKAIVGAG